MDKLCEICGMAAVASTTDAKGVTHYFCEHHNPKTPIIQTLDQIETTPKDYLLFAGVISFIFTASFVYQAFSVSPGFISWIADFMGIFFLTFSFFKFLDLKGFAASYIGYDLIASKFHSYAYAYPFIELSLGLGYLLFPNQTLLNLITLIVMTIGAIGVGKQLLRGSKIRCACLGTYIKLPLTTVSLTEDLAMGVMALVMLILSLTNAQLL